MKFLSESDFILLIIKWWDITLLKAKNNLLKIIKIDYKVKLKAL